jgi:hypothetical protein
VWDIYSNADQDAGVIPGTAAQDTYILSPKDCSTDLPGVVQSRHGRTPWVLDAPLPSGGLRGGGVPGPPALLLPEAGLCG